MFGSAVPVCAVYFPALRELVKNGNGIIFRKHTELSAQLFRLFCDFPHEKKILKELHKMKEKTQQIGCWEDNWREIVRPVVLSSLDQKCLSVAGDSVSASMTIWWPLVRWIVLVLVVALAIARLYP